MKLVGSGRRGERLWARAGAVERTCGWLGVKVNSLGQVRASAAVRLRLPGARQAVGGTLVLLVRVS